MSQSRQHTAETAQHERLRGAVRGVVASAERPLTTEEISEALAAPPGPTRECLRALAGDGTLTRRDRGEPTQWTMAMSDVQVRSEANSFRAKDTETGIVTRAGTRPDALRRLAERLEQHEAGATVGARIIGISESELSPGYARSVDELVTEYVEPADKHLYVYVAEEGVREIETPEHLQREYEVVGFAVTGQFSRSEFDEAIRPSATDLLAETPISDEHFPLSMFKLVAVHPDYQSQGIGTALTTHGMAYLAEHPPVVTMLWERENESNVKLAESWGGRRLAEYENTSPSQWECPECGFDTRCTCTSAFYGWGFE